MTYEVPEPDEVTAPWWEATREHRLVVQTCEDCGARQHPPRALCTACGRTDRLAWTEESGAGTVDACTVVERAMPGFEPPYVVARITTASGVLMLSNVVSEDPYSIEVGQPVHLIWRALPDGRALPIFERN